MTHPEPLSAPMTPHDLVRHIKYIWHSDERSVEETNQRDRAITAELTSHHKNELESAYWRGYRDARKNIF